MARIEKTGNNICGVLTGVIFVLCPISGWVFALAAYQVVITYLVKATVAIFCGIKPPTLLDIEMLDDSEIVVGLASMIVWTSFFASAFLWK